MGNVIPQAIHKAHRSWSEPDDKIPRQLFPVRALHDFDLRGQMFPGPHHGLIPPPVFNLRL